MGNLDLTWILLVLATLVVSITFHEFMHAWSANELGDPTAKRMGRLSLNPIVHFDPLGALMIVFTTISGWGIGWGKPVPVSPNNLRGNARVSMGLTSVAGPFSNLVLATVAAVPIRLVGSALPNLVIEFLWIMVFVNVGLALFNLIPLPPLDGFGVVQGVLATQRGRWAHDLNNTLDRLAPYGPMLLLALLSLGWIGGWSPLSFIFGPPRDAIISLLLGYLDGAGRMHLSRPAVRAGGGFLVSEGGSRRRHSGRPPAIGRSDPLPGHAPLRPAPRPACVACTAGQWPGRAGSSGGGVAA